MAVPGSGRQGFVYSCRVPGCWRDPFGAATRARAWGYGVAQWGRGGRRGDPRALLGVFGADCSLCLVQREPSVRGALWAFLSSVNVKVVPCTWLPFASPYVFRV